MCVNAVIVRKHPVEYLLKRPCCAFLSPVVSSVGFSACQWSEKAQIPMLPHYTVRVMRETKGTAQENVLSLRR